MSRSDRLFEIIQLLRRTKRPLTADGLAATLEVTARTVYRDIAALQSMRVPIEGAAGVGYIMRPGFDLPPVMFTPEEVEAMAVGLALLGRTGDKDLMRAASRVRRKLTEVLPAGAVRDFDEISLHVSNFGVLLPDTANLAQLRAAVRGEQKLRLVYRNAEGIETVRIVLPLAVFYYVEVVLLAAWCELRRGFRHFRVDRIETCTPLGELFKKEGANLRARWRAEREIA